MGEMTGQLKLTSSIKVLPSPGTVFRQPALNKSFSKPPRPCQVDSIVAHIDIAPINHNNT